MYESPVWEHLREAKLIYKRNASVCRWGVATIALVPQESSWNSNRTLEPSVSLGLQRGSSSLVLSGSTEGQVTPGVVTTVTTPPAEHTDRAHTHLCRAAEPAELQDLHQETSSPIMSWVLKRQLLEVDVWTSSVLESLRTS